MIRVKLWGTRGSITSPGRATWYYGGNTSCVELIGFQNDEPGAAIRPDNPRLILDAGSGLAALQTPLLKGACGRGQGELHFLVSHYHWDHLIGLPFFAPIFVKGNRIAFYGDSVKNLRPSIERLFASAYAPQMQYVGAELAYCRVEPEGMEVAGFQVKAGENRHPLAKALSYRIQYGPHVVVYSTDHEAGDQAVDAKLVELARGAHLWIIDAMFTREERPQREGWGHSSYLEAVDLALEAEVKTVVLFHHAPDHDDGILDQIGREAAKVAAGTHTKVLMSRDGMVVDVGNGNG
jgi:ribonuclease BN (tRNA processing enzyme)